MSNEQERAVTNGSKRKIIDGVLIVLISTAFLQGVMLWKEYAVISANRWTVYDHTQYATDEARRQADQKERLNETLTQIKEKLATLPLKFPPVEYESKIDSKLDTITKTLADLRTEVARLSARKPPS